MIISYASYELRFVHSINAVSSSLKRQGALLKIHFSSRLVGYADCHPWPELGDLPLNQQFKELTKGNFTSLIRSALAFAKIDAEYRLQKKNILTQPIPSSHFLMTSLMDCTSQDIEKIIKGNYTHVKLKVGRHLEQEEKKLITLFLDSPLKIRLDFNEMLTFKTFCEFLNRIQKLKKQIEFIEDPFPFQPHEWEVIQKEGWMLACDRSVTRGCHYPQSAGVLVIKPALHYFEEWQKWDRQMCVVTSYLDHPLGQVAAAYVATQIDPSCRLVHGLLSHHVYHPTSFSQQLNWKDSQFTIPSGTGFGFDQELEQLNWIKLV